MSTLNGMGSVVVVVRTADSTVVADTDNGKTFTNEGDTGTQVLSLPAATVGQTYRFQLMAAFEMRLDPNGTETIALPSSGAQGAAGKYLTADAVGEYVELTCLKAGRWEVTAAFGTWTAEA